MRKFWLITLKIFISIVTDEDEMHTARISAFSILYLGNRVRNYEQVQVGARFLQLKRSPYRELLSCELRDSRVTVKGRAKVFIGYG